MQQSFMDMLIRMLDSLISVVLQILVAFINILQSITNSELGEKSGLGDSGKPMPSATVEMLREAGVDDILRIAIPALLAWMAYKYFFSGSAKGFLKRG